MLYRKLYRLFAESAPENLHRIFRENGMRKINGLIDLRNWSLRLEWAPIQIGTNCTSHWCGIRLACETAEGRASTSDIRELRATKTIVCSQRTKKEEGLTDRSPRASNDAEELQWKGPTNAINSIDFRAPK
jgi:hypothetical protein